MDIYEAFSKLSSEEWYGILQRSVKEPVINGVRLPGFPDEELQAGVVGSAGEQSLAEGLLLYQEIVRYAEGIDRSTHILDFGCGWGRHYRFYLKDVPPRNIVGVDCDRDFIEICKSTIPMGHFKHVDTFPPTDLATASFDIVFAYSVFSHLNEEIGLAWIAELTRVLKPGGLLLVTTHRKTLIETCEGLRRDPQLQVSPWHKSLARNGFLDAPAALAAYQRGEFLFAATGGGGVRTPDIYGEAILAKGYVERMWTRELKLVDFVDDPARLPQVLIVLRKG